MDEKVGLEALDFIKYMRKATWCYENKDEFEACQQAMTDAIDNVVSHLRKTYNLGALPPYLSTEPPKEKNPPPNSTKPL